MIGAKISSNRSSILLDSTSNMDTIFYGGFPLLFPLGQGLERMKTGFSRKFHLHLVSQFTNAFANNQHALFLMLNMCMMAAMIASVRMATTRRFASAGAANGLPAAAVKRGCKCKCKCTCK